MSASQALPPGTVVFTAATPMQVTIAVADPPPPLPTPPQPPVALGIYATNKAANGWTDSFASTQKRLVGVAPGIVHRFMPWYLSTPQGGTWGAWDSAWADDAITCGSLPMISWECRDLSLPAASQPATNNAAVLSGSWDSALIAWLTQAGAWLAAPSKNPARFPKNRLLLRLFHEGNGRWFPWACGCNGNSVESYIAAHRHVTRLVRAYAIGAEIPWTPGTSGAGWTNLEETYPGLGGYVDWLGADFYNTGLCAGGWSGGWQEFSAFRPYYDRLCRLDPDKGIILAEFGCADDPAHGSKPAWYANIPAALASMPRIKALVAFDNTDSATIDFRISASQANYDAWKALCALPVMAGTL